MDYVQPYSAHRVANVLGTFQIIQLATKERLKPLHYASSSAIFGPTGLIRSQWLYENEDIRPFLDLVLFDTGYTQSKWVAEAMMHVAMNRGLRATIHRLGFVLCDQFTGVGNPDDFVGRFVSDVFVLGTYPTLPANRKELTTVDYVVSTMLLVSMSPENLDSIYHILPDHENVRDMSLERFREALENISGRRLEQLPYHEWVSQLVKMNSMQPMRLGAVIPMMEEKIMVKKTRWEVYEGMARLCTDNVSKVWARVGRPHLADSGVTEDHLARYMAFLGFPVFQSYDTKKRS